MTSYTGFFLNVYIQNLETEYWTRKLTELNSVLNFK